jgi:hypothetical protein
MWTEQYKINIEEAPMLFGGGEIQFAQNGAKLEEVETSEDPNVIPEGAMHKNKNHLDDLDITVKGIPVISTEKEVKEGTLEEIKESGEITQHAEIEADEIIFSKELTDFIEEKRKEWHEHYKQDGDILLEVGKRVTKEILTNTNDNTNLIEKMEGKE